MLAASAAVATSLLVFAQTYEQFLLAALGVGLAGGSFAVGVAYVSRFYPQNKQGTALGIFGVGNVGAAVTKFLAPFVMVAFGWPGSVGSGGMSRMLGITIGMTPNAAYFARHTSTRTEGGMAG